MNDPPEPYDPQARGEHELDDRFKQPPLNELAESRNKEATDCRNHIARGTLSRHWRLPRLLHYTKQAPLKGLRRG